MTESLKRALARIKLLPPEQQDAIAEVIQTELDEREWDTIVTKPASQRFLQELAAEARQEDAAGETRASAGSW